MPKVDTGDSHQILPAIVDKALTSISNHVYKSKRRVTMENHHIWSTWIRSRSHIELVQICTSGSHLDYKTISEGCGLPRTFLGHNPLIQRDFFAIEQELREHGFLKPLPAAIPTGICSPDGRFALLGAIGRVDPTFKSITAGHPEMESWRALAHRYVSYIAHDLELTRFSGEEKTRIPRLIRIPLSYKIKSLTVFLVDYLQSTEHPERRAIAHNPSLFFKKESQVQDDFWHECCLSLVDPRRTKAGSRQWHRAATLSVEVTEFLKWVLSVEYPANQSGDGAIHPEYHCPFSARTSSAALKEKPLTKSVDFNLAWVRYECPHLEEWRVKASQWIRQQARNVSGKLSALSKFISGYLNDAQLICPTKAISPKVFLLKSSGIPNNFRSTITPSAIGKHDYIVDFLDWILLHDCSETDDTGFVTVSSAYRNPFTRMVGTVKSVDTGESAKSPLPYGYIDELRRILVQGPHFRDWTWAHQAMSSKQRGGFGADWFRVSENQIDENDPNCVWRERTIKVTKTRYKVILEMWSPVRWVVLLTKNIIALRTAQVRVLDSGEADTWRYDGAELNSHLLHKTPWVQNETNCELREQAMLSALAESASSHHSPSRNSKATAQRNYSRGVLRRKSEMVRNSEGALITQESTELYINTNKTADLRKTGVSKGYAIPWPELPWPLLPDGSAPIFETQIERTRWLGDLARNIHYWLQQMRDWQSKYNPVTKLTSWNELVENALVTTLSEDSLDGFCDAVFLFREPAWGDDDDTESGRSNKKAHLPLTGAMVQKAWWYLLKELQDRLAARGHTAPDGSRVILVRGLNDQDRLTFFPLHSLRVSLITALALEGGMDLHLLQKVVGHSRLLMTLYYIKPSQSDLLEALERAHERLTASEERSTNKWLRAQSIERLRDETAYNDLESAFSALGVEVADRNPAGWMTMHHGVCPVGGNTDPTPENMQIGGCHNGGDLIASTGGGGARNRRYGPVPGGARNCVRCRWFVTEPRFIPALVAQFNNISFRYHEAQEEAIVKVEELEQLKDQEWDLEQSGSNIEAAAILQKIQTTQRQHETTIKKLADVAETMAACHRLVMRCMTLLEARKSNEDSESVTTLVANGGDIELKVIMEATDSELLQLSGVTEDAEIFTDLGVGKAVLRKSQLLDRALVRDGLGPHFLSLSEKQQRLIGNEFVRRLGQMFDKKNVKRGRRMAIKAIEHDDLKLSQILGCDQEDIKALISAPVEPRPLYANKLSHQSKTLNLNAS